MFGLTSDQLMAIGGLLGGAGQGINQNGWRGGFAGAQQGLLNAQQMQQAQEMMRLRKAAAAMQEQQFARETAKMDRESKAEDAMRVALTGDYTGGLVGPDMPRAPGMAPAGGLLAGVPESQRGLLGAYAQADPKGVGSMLLSQAMKGPEKPIAVPKDTVLYDPRTNKPVFENKGNDPQSAIAKIQADLAAGRITPEQYAIGISKMGPAQVNVNNVGKAEETAEAKGVGGFYADVYKDTQNQGLSAQSQKARINRAKQLLANISTGTVTPTTAAVKGAFRDVMGADALNALGIKDDTPVADALRSLGTQFTLGFVDQTKGSVSNAEMELFQKASVGLANSTEGNMLILEMAEGLADRQQKVAKLAREYRQRKGRIDEGFMGELEKFHAENPLFTDDLSKRIDSTMATTAPAAETKIIGGKTYVKRGTMWFEQ